MFANQTADASYMALLNGMARKTVRDHRIVWVCNPTTSNRPPAIAPVVTIDQHTAREAYDRAKYLNNLFANRMGQFEARRVN
jgi:hypothetical protein